MELGQFDLTLYSTTPVSALVGILEPADNHTHPFSAKHTSTTVESMRELVDDGCTAKSTVTIHGEQYRENGVDIDDIFDCNVAVPRVCDASWTVSIAMRPLWTWETTPQNVRRGHGVRSRCTSRFVKTARR